MVYGHEKKPDFEKLIQETDLKRKHVVLAIVSWFRRAELWKIRDEYCHVFDLNPYSNPLEKSHPVSVNLYWLIEYNDVERLKRTVYQIRKHGFEKLLFLRDKGVLPDYLWKPVKWTPRDFEFLRGEDINLEAYDVYKEG